MNPSIFKDKSAEEILCDYVEIHSPGRLVGVVSDLRELIKKSLLKQVGGDSKIESIPDAPPFNDDVITMEFETIPGKTRYILVCETYHGSGGYFKRSDYVDKEAKAVFEKRVVSENPDDLISTEIPKEQFTLVDTQSKKRR